MIWIVFAAMVALTLVVLLRPLLAPAGAVTARGEYDLMVYKDQLGELGRDVERGLLTAAQAEAARTEIQRRMLAAMDGDAPGKAAVKPGKATPIAIALILPLLALIVYLPLGVPELPDRPYAGRAAQIAEMKEKAATVQAMVTRLAERLKQDPSDGKGWAMLGRSYRALGMVGEAKEAYLKAMPLLPADAQSRVEYAVLLLDEAMDDTLPPEATSRMREALAIDPNQPDALYFVGLDAAQKGDSAKARELWTRLLMSLPANSPASQQVQQSIDSLK